MERKFLLLSLIISLLLVITSCSYSDDDDRYLTPVSPNSGEKIDETEPGKSSALIQQRKHNQAESDGFMII